MNSEVVTYGHVRLRCMKFAHALDAGVQSDDASGERAQDCGDRKRGTLCFSGDINGEGTEFNSLFTKHAHACVRNHLFPTTSCTIYALAASPSPLPSACQAQFIFMSILICTASLTLQVMVELYWKHAPKTCQNFASLAARGYYNNTKFHRIIPGFMVQVCLRSYE